MMNHRKQLQPKETYPLIKNEYSANFARLEGTDACNSDSEKQVSMSIMYYGKASV